MYAMRAMRENNYQEAAGLLSEALQEASSLKGRAAYLLQSLLELRADVHDALQDEASAAAIGSMPQSCAPLKHRERQQ